MSAPRVTVVDGALPPALFRRLLRRVAGLGTERLRAGMATSFWFPLHARPTSVVEEAAVALTQLVPAPGAAGVEWWLSRMRTSRVTVDFHRDRDNAHFARTGRTRSPSVSSVLYLNRCVGGLLAVSGQPAEPANPAMAPSLHDFDLVEPRPNRLVFFPGQLVHGVLDAHNRIPGGWCPRQPRLRLAVALNWWRRPVEAPVAFSSSPHFRGLLVRPRNPT